MNRLIVIHSCLKYVHLKIHMILCCLCLRRMLHFFPFTDVFLFSDLKNGYVKKQSSFSFDISQPYRFHLQNLCLLWMAAEIE